MQGQRGGERLRRGYGILTGLAAVLAAAGGAVAQQSPAPAATTAPSQGGPDAGGVDLSRKYRFSETFTTTEAPQKPGEVSQQLVAFRETLSTLTDNPGGAPKSQQTVIQARYAERAAELSTLDARQVVAVIREYQAVRITPEPQVTGGGSDRPFENLLIRVEQRTNERPLVLSLRKGRSLSDAEYYLASQHLFAPSLILALPDLPLRVGDSYRVSRPGAEALMGQPVAEGVLNGTFQQIRPAANTEDSPVALFDITGEVQIQSEAGPVPVGVHAQLLFAMEAPPVPGFDTTVDAPGHITRLVLAQEMTVPVDPERRLFQSMRRELILDRRTDPKQVGRLLTIPDYKVEPSPENSWLTYADPQGRFRLRHPQSYRPLPGPDDDTLQLIEMRPGGPDLIALRFQPRAELEPESARKGRLESWKADGINAIPGTPSAELLPEANWPGMRVYHFDARLVPPSPAEPAGGAALAGRDGSVYFDGYIIHTGRETGVWVEATTPREGPEHDTFRRTTEAVLRHLTFEGAAPSAPPAAAAPAAAPAPASAPAVAPASAPSPLSLPGQP